MTINLTKNFLSNSRGLSLTDGGGVVWSINKNTNSITATVSGASGGTVTSVGLVDGSTTPIVTVSGSPVTVSGNLTFTLKTQSANTVFAGPTTGAAAQPTFRALVAADIQGITATWSGLQTFNGGINVTAGTITFGGFTFSLSGNAVVKGTNTGDQPAFNPQTGNYTLVASDNGKAIWIDGGSAQNITVPAGVFAQGNVVELIGWSGTIGTTVTTIVQGASLTMYLTTGVGTTGNRSLKTPGIAWLKFLDTNTVLIYGFGLT